MRALMEGNMPWKVAVTRARCSLDLASKFASTSRGAVAKAPAGARYCTAAAARSAQVLQPAMRKDSVGPRGTRATRR